MDAPEAPRRSRRIRDAVDARHAAVPAVGGGGADQDANIGRYFPTDKAELPLKSKQVIQAVQKDLEELQSKLERQVRKQRQNIEESKLLPLVDEPVDAKRRQVAADVKNDRLEPWNGRLGYACLNTYLRTADPPVFCSRTTRISTIENRSHPLLDPSRPYHPKHNAPDVSKPADRARGLDFVRSLGLANARDMTALIRWNVHFGIRFMRLSSEMFPFASHEKYGYRLDFARDVLEAAGKVAAELDHRVSMHPGQFTQLGSPHADVVRASIRELEYHDQLLTLMKLPDRLDKDAVMILHMGGVFGDKAATMERFAGTYETLPARIKRRLVLENDDVCYTVHDLLPTCEALSIPLVLDWHHHRILFDAESGVEGAEEELLPLLPRIAATWKSKGIRQKMHYSEPCAGAVTARERRKHSRRVAGLPSWRPPSGEAVDLIIEAKDKEQAVLELMRRFQGDGWSWEGVGEVIPHQREDQRGELAGMGGEERRVHWPEGYEDWLKPRKRARKRKFGEGEASDDGVV